MQPLRAELTIEARSEAIGGSAPTARQAVSAGIRGVPCIDQVASSANLSAIALPERIA